MEKNIVTLIAGKINRDCQILYWKIDNCIMFEIGDYAIVENKDSYDLVEIIGDVETTEEKAKLFSKVDYCKMKNVVTLIDKRILKKRK